MGKQGQLLKEVTFPQQAESCSCRSPRGTQARSELEVGTVSALRKKQEVLSSCHLCLTLPLTCDGTCSEAEPPDLLLQPGSCSQLLVPTFKDTSLAFLSIVPFQSSHLACPFLSGEPAATCLRITEGIRYITLEHRRHYTSVNLESEGGGLPPTTWHQDCPTSTFSAGSFTNNSQEPIPITYCPRGQLASFLLTMNTIERMDFDMEGGEGKRPFSHRASCSSSVFLQSPCSKTEDCRQLSVVD